MRREKLPKRGVVYVKGESGRGGRERSSTADSGFIAQTFGEPDAIANDHVPEWLHGLDDKQRCADAFCSLIDRLSGSKRDVSIIRDVIMGYLGSRGSPDISALKWMYLALPYQEYLATRHWKEIRERKLKAAEFRCQLCNSLGVELHVHHRTYERIGRERDGDLIVLCKDCHSHFHDKLKLK